MRKSLAITVLVALCAACGGDEDSPTTSSGPASTAPAAPVSAAQALTMEGAGPIAVAGYLFVTPDSVRLCDSILESFPPQCGEPSIEVEGDPRIETLGVQTGNEGDVTWTDQPATLTGTVEDGRLVLG